MTRAGVANIENAKQRVLAHTVQQLARGLSVTESQLFGTFGAGNAKRRR
jgi:hypothetical protein